MKIRSIPAAAAAVLVAASSPVVHAQDANAQKSNAPYPLFGDWLEGKAGIRALGYLRVASKQTNVSADRVAYF